jgi:creatinine amidohydrolase
MTAQRSAAIEYLSPLQIEERLSRLSVAYLPLGSLEFHGPHLPIGLDALTAHGICLAAADRGGGIVLPPWYSAVGGEHTAYPWTFMSQTPASIESLLAETLSRLDQLGVRRIVLLSGHFAGEQAELVTRVANAWNSRGASSHVVARTLGQAPTPPVAPDHAARFESLVLHALHPELVELDKLPDPDLFPAPADENPFGPDRHRVDHPLYGVFGPDPRRLDTAAAQPLLDYLVGWVSELGATGE